MLKTSKGGTLCSPSDVYVRSFLCSFLYFNETLLHKSSWVIKPGPGPEAKSSSEIMNLTPLTVSYQSQLELWRWFFLHLWGLLHLRSPSSFSSSIIFSSSISCSQGPGHCVEHRLHTVGKSQLRRRHQAPSNPAVPPEPMLWFPSSSLSPSVRLNASNGREVTLSQGGAGCF